MSKFSIIKSLPFCLIFEIVLPVTYNSYVGIWSSKYLPRKLWSFSILSFYLTSNFTHEQILKKVVETDSYVHRFVFSRTVKDFNAKIGDLFVGLGPMVCPVSCPRDPHV